MLCTNEHNLIGNSQELIRAHILVHLAAHSRFVWTGFRCSKMLGHPPLILISCFQTEISLEPDIARQEGRCHRMRLAERDRKLQRTSKLGYLPSIFCAVLGLLNGRPAWLTALKYVSRVFMHASMHTGVQVIRWSVKRRAVQNCKRHVLE